MADWNGILEQATQLRHTLHQHPELGWHEHQTAQRVREQLDMLGVQWRACAETGTLAWINPQGSGKTIALRGDMDALPMHEQTGKPYASEHEGCMHACGHDGHTASLIATAAWLKAHEDSLKHRIVLVFQPAEEGGHGAKAMIEDGALEGVDEIYGWHNWPALPFGEIACPEGIVMCGNGTFRLTVKGVGGHASQPEVCRDPVLAASAIVLALQQVVSRRVAPQESAVLSLTSFDAPSAATVIPGQAVLEGSIRVPNQAVRQTLNEAIEEISQSVAQSYGCKCEVEIFPRYEATINHAQPSANVRRAWQSLWGNQALNKSLPMPLMASEDFSYYLNTIPGAFALIGSDDGDDHHHPCHSVHYDFNDRLIPRVVSLYSALVEAPLPPHK